MRDTRSYDQRKMDEARERERTGNTISCNDRTDFPEYRQTRRCVGQCTPDRNTLTAANDAMSAASGAASLVMGMLNPNKLGYHDYREEEEQEFGAAADRRRAGEDAYYEQRQRVAQSYQIEANHAALLGQCSPDERAIYQTHLEALAAGHTDTLTPMGLGRGEGGSVERREAQPVRRFGR